MQTLPFADGDELPMIGLGTWKSAPGEVYDAVKYALDTGYHHLDCASIYGNEAEVGQALSESVEAGVVERDDVWVTSKLWNDAHRPEDTELEVWGEHAMRGTEGAEVIPELEPEADDDVFEKRFYDGFRGTGLDEHLRSLGVDRVVVTGLHTNMCARHTSASAFFNGYDIAAPEDCLDAFSQEAHEGGLEYLEEVYHAEVTAAAELAAGWNS
jgi:nicotinamidase-related amidase